MNQPLLPLSDARAEALRLGSSWAKIPLADLDRVIEHIVKLSRILGAVRAVPVINGEFVDVAALYRALEVTPARPAAACDPDQMPGRWREHALDLAAEVHELRQRIADLEAAAWTATEVNNLQIAEIKRLRAETAMRHYRHVIRRFGLPDVLSVLCMECFETPGVPETQFIVLSAEGAPSPTWPWTLEQLNAAAREHDRAHHRPPGRRRRRPHNRAARRAQTQERDTP